MSVPCTFCGVRPDVPCKHKRELSATPATVLEVGVPLPRDPRAHKDGGMYRIDRARIAAARKGLTFKWGEVAE